MDVLSWLGAYHVKNEMYEKAIEYFHMASQIQPHEVLPNQTSSEPQQSAAQPWADGLTDCARCNMQHSVASEHKKDGRSGPVGQCVCAAQRAMAPPQVKWQLMVASCHRRIGAYQQALRIYETIHKKHPDNIECLNYLVRPLGASPAASTRSVTSSLVARFV